MSAKMDPRELKVYLMGTLLGLDKNKQEANLEEAFNVKFMKDLQRAAEDYCDHADIITLILRLAQTKAGIAKNTMIQWEKKWLELLKLGNFDSTVHFEVKAFTAKAQKFLDAYSELLTTVDDLPIIKPYIDKCYVQDQVGQAGNA